MNKRKFAAPGFTLIELAIVMVIVSLLLGGLLSSISSQKEQQRRNDNQSLLKLVSDALIGFATVNGRLPCPDTSGNGLENTPCSAAASNINNGILPYATLGVISTDPWGNPLRYTVNGAFSAAPPNPVFTLSTQGTGNGILRIFNTAPGNCNTPGNVAENIPAVVWTGAKRDYTLLAPPSTDEMENRDNDNCFVSRDYNTVTGREFDDQLIWLSSNILFNRMVSAGVLP